MHSCPRCQVELRSGERDHFCPNHHGALLTLKDFQEDTSKSFTKWFYSSWLRFGNKRTISCPACNTKMIQLTVEGKSRFDLDCCPSCFALWLDSGEDVLLQKLFQMQHDAEKVRDLTSEQHEILGKILIKHDGIIHRYKALDKIGRYLRRRPRVFERMGFHRGSFFFSDEDEK